MQKPASHRGKPSGVLFEPLNTKHQIPNTKHQTPPTEPSVRDVILERQQNGEWTTKARFVWSPDTQSYHGPSGSIEDGFLASTKSLEPADIERILESAEGVREKETGP